MKLLLLIITVLTILASVTLADAESFEAGADITAMDLASQLGVKTASMIYRQDTAFSKISVGLFYLERNAAGKLEEKQPLLYATYSLPHSTTEQSIKILYSSERCTVIVSGFSSTGKGVTMEAPYSTSNPPTRLKDGRLVLASTYADPMNSSEERIKSILQLTVSVSE